MISNKYNFKIVKNIVRHFSSALYITGDKAQKNFVVLYPVIDFEDQLKNKTDLLENIKLRQLPINLNKVEEKWNFYKEIEKSKLVLDQTRMEIGKTLAELMKLEKNDTVTTEIEKLRTHLTFIKEDFKNVRNMSYSIEEGAVLQVLGLPNILHPKTPHDNELELYSYLDKPNIKTESHMTIGNNKKYLKYINPMSCYLKSEAALFEFAVQNYFNNELLNLSYVEFSNSDFVKSVVIEGCGDDISDKSELLTLEDIHCIKTNEVNKLHLTGSSSLYSFMAYFARHFVPKTQLPLKAFCSGRRYCTVNKNSAKNLFNLNQSSEVCFFMTSLENPGIEDILDDIVGLYKNLGYHFRVVLTPANKIKKAESLRMSVQMYSTHLCSYIEVGSVSFYEDYISKRLLLNYLEDKERRYPKVIGGNIINIHKVLGCVLEYTSIKEQPLLSDLLYRFI